MSNEVLNTIYGVVAIVGPVITIIGFIISGTLQRDTFRNDIKKIQEEKVYSKIENLPYELLKIMRSIFESKDDTDKIINATRRLLDLEDKIVAYGSMDAIAICCYIQEGIYLRRLVNPFEIMSAFGLLISQLKKDLSNKTMAPDVFYRITINDYEQQKRKIIDFSNGIIAELRLDTGFRLKY